MAGGTGPSCVRHLTPRVCKGLCVYESYYVRQDLAKPACLDAMDDATWNAFATEVKFVVRRHLRRHDIRNSAP